MEILIYIGGIVSGIVAIRLWDAYRNAQDNCTLVCRGPRRE